MINTLMTRFAFDMNQGNESQAAMFVALSRFTIRNEMDEQVRTAFRERPHLVDRAPGFIRMEVMSPLETPKDIWLATWWTDGASIAAGTVATITTRRTRASRRA